MNVYYTHTMQTNVRESCEDRYNSKLNTDVETTRGKDNSSPEKKDMKRISEAFHISYTIAFCSCNTGSM